MASMNAEWFAKFREQVKKDITFKLSADGSSVTIGFSGESQEAALAAMRNEGKAKTDRLDKFTDRVRTLGTGTQEYLSQAVSRLWAEADLGADKERHGRKPSGIQKPGAKLNVELVCQIRVMITSGVPIKRIAAQFGVSRKAIQQVRDGRTWKGVGA